jgi:hypothetical protein
MTYSITVSTVAGKPSVEVSGDVPDGKHIVNGHVGEAGSSLSVSRLTAEGLPVTSAHVTHSKGA